jgi:hypothetical protein
MFGCADGAAGGGGVFDTLSSQPDGGLGVRPSMISLICESSMV